MQRPSARLGGIVLSLILKRNHVRVFGRGSETLVWAHGFGSDQNAWRPQVEVFQDRYRIVTFDHTGCGQSDISAYHPLRYNSLYSFAHDLTEIGGDLGLKGATLIGHSAGGAIGLLASLLDPPLFGRLILIGVSPRYLNDGEYQGGFEQSHLDTMFQSAGKDYLHWVSGFAPQAMKNSERPELAEGFADTLRAMRPDIALSILKVIMQSDHRAELSRVALPAWILQSTADIAVPRYVGQYLHRHLRSSRYIELSAEGHLPHISAPAEINAAIASALQNSHSELQ